MKTLWQVIVYQWFSIFSIAISGVFATLFYPLMNVDSMNALVSIYSILAGFLIGVISLLGDPMLIPQGSWRVAHASMTNIHRSLTSTKLLLYIYLTTLLLIFLHKIVFSYTGSLPVDMAFKDQIDAALKWIATYKDNIDQIVLFFSLLAFLFSFKLPSKLYEIQKLRAEHEMSIRMKKDNVSDND
ncbi:hypothetical protein RC856_003222 [Vibrio fluvialis]|nr:hypothetical protein [Vibrio fluvialis]